MDDWYPVRLKDRKTKHYDGIGVKHNTGMAYVVPAWRLLDILYSDDLKMQREQITKQYEREVEEAAVTLDAALEQEQPPFTKADFEAALKKVARKISQEK
jgi:hypothetical protein